MIDTDRRLLTIKEVLEMSGTSRNQLYRDMDAGRIRSIHFGRNVRFKQEEAERYAEYKGQSKKVQLWKEKKKQDITQQGT